MTKTLVSIGAVTALLCSVSLALAADNASQKFVKMGIQGNLAEVSMGQLAQEKGQSEGIKSFGQQLVKDHTDANQKLMGVASSVSLTPPTEPTRKQMADHDKMAKMSGAKFDREFAKHMVMDHKKDIKDYEKATKMRNADAVASYANQTLPTLNQHLEMAQSLAKSSGKGM